MSGGRGTGRPLDSFCYGNRLCQFVRSYRTRVEAESHRSHFENMGILSVVRKWYSQWAVYRCGVRKRGWRIVRSIKRMATFTTTIGVMLIPLAITLLQVIDNFSRFWFSVVMLIGVVIIILGLRITIKEERQKREEIQARIRKEKASLIVLAHIAEGLGVDMDKVLKMMEDR